MDNALDKAICRTCLTEASSYKSLLCKIDGDDRTLREVLSNLTNMDVKTNDKYPKQVCDECHIMILKGDEFKKQCLQSEAILKNGFLSHTFEELLKREFVNTDQGNAPNTQLQSQITSNTYLDSITKNLAGATETEVPLDNFYTTDLLKSELYCVKEEQDDFLEDDINDLAENIAIENSPIEKLDITNTDNHSLTIEISDVISDKKDSEITKTENLNDGDSKEITLVCSICNEEYNDIHLLQLHALTHNPVISSKDNMSICKTDISHEILNNQVKYHKNKIRARKKKLLKNVLDNKQLSITLICPKCKEIFANMESFQLHLKIHLDEPYLVDQTINTELKDKVPEYQCSMCMRKFVRKNSLVSHIKKHEDSAQVKFMCKTCKREFQHKAHLENHVVLVHSKDKGFPCDICAKSFSTQECLDSHKERHKVNRKHECSVCEKSFTMLSTLTEHLKIHTGEKPYLCSICGRGFSQKNNMAQHMRRHQGLKPFKCDTCEQRFVSKGELVAHSRKHSGAHPFVCDECGGSFTTSSSLTKHRRIHTGERRYQCDLCPMRFTALNTLKNHRRTHTGEKPYHCSYCEKAFTQRTDLVTHIRCHTGERPYVCTSCGQAFRKAAALKAHIKIHGKDPILM